MIISLSKNLLIKSLDLKFSELTTFVLQSVYAKTFTSGRTFFETNWEWYDILCYVSSLLNLFWSRMDVALKRHRLTIKVGMKYKAYRIILIVQIKWCIAFFSLYTFLTNYSCQLYLGSMGNLGPVLEDLWRWRL